MFIKQFFPVQNLSKQGFYSSEQNGDMNKQYKWRRMGNGYGCGSRLMLTLGTLLLIVEYCWPEFQPGRVRLATDSGWPAIIMMSIPPTKHRSWLVPNGTVVPNQKGGFFPISQTVNAAVGCSQGAEYSSSSRSSWLLFSTACAGRWWFSMSSHGYIKIPLGSQIQETSMCMILIWFWSGF